MAKRRSKSPPGPAWRDVPPTRALYWALGGPVVPVDRIDAEPLGADRIGGTLKPAARRKWALECLKNSEGLLAAERTRYLDLIERGIEAVDPTIREAWEHRVHTCAVKADEPDPVSERKALAFEGIRYHLGRIAACHAALAEVDRQCEPLLFWKGE